MEFEPVIGLEVHLHLKTKTKAFCGCSTEFGGQPNSQVCPVCLGFPGTLPVLNKVALEYAIKAGLALNCTVNKFTKFDRKNYFYPDLPKDYQISQYDFPVSSNGFLEIDIDGKIKRIGITRAHLEEDAGKLIHKDSVSLVDFNRTGIALLEIVSMPEINSPQEAYEYLTGLKSILKYLGVSDCDMEKGSLRCDANVSIRPKGTIPLGVKAELKNMNSFKAVRDALEYEIERQAKCLEAGEKIIQETRLWDEKQGCSVVMRTKEGAQDYRYFPEPDLTTFIIDSGLIDEIRKSIPELPREKYQRFIKEYGLSIYDAKLLVLIREDADFAESCMQTYANNDKKLIVNWLNGALLSEANARNCQLCQLGIKAQDLVELVNFVERQEISNLSAKTVLTQMIETKKGPAEIIKEKNLSQISDTGALDGFIEEAIKENEKSVADYKAGKENALMFLVGQVMKKSKGKANPKTAQELIKRRLENA